MHLQCNCLYLHVFGQVMLTGTLSLNEPFRLLLSDVPAHLLPGQDLRTPHHSRVPLLSCSKCTSCRLRPNSLSLTVPKRGTHGGKHMRACPSSPSHPLDLSGIQERSSSMSEGTHPCLNVLESLCIDQHYAQNPSETC